jgi:hypothetical protein
MRASAFLSRCFCNTAAPLALRPSANISAAWASQSAMVSESKITAASQMANRACMVDLLMCKASFSNFSCGGVKRKREESVTAYAWGRTLPEDEDGDSCGTLFLTRPRTNAKPEPVYGSGLASPSRNIASATLLTHHVPSPTGKPLKQLHNLAMPWAKRLVDFPVGLEDTDQDTAIDDEPCDTDELGIAEGYYEIRRRARNACPGGAYYWAPEIPAIQD